MAARYHIPPFRLGNHAETTLRHGVTRWSCAAAVLLLLAACGAQEEPGAEVAVGELLPDERPLVPVPASATPRDHAVIEVEGHGTIRLELLADVAPKTVARFTELATSGFYDGTTFHRVLPGFMIQGGDPNSRNRDPRDDGLGSSELGNVDDEFSDISHVRGIVSFANRARTRSGDCQFFIMVGDNPHLDGRYSVFAHVVEGEDVAEAISLVERDKYGRWGAKDRPRENVTITAIRIERASEVEHAGAAPKPADADAVGRPNEAAPAPETSVAARESAG